MAHHQLAHRHDRSRRGRRVLRLLAARGTRAAAGDAGGRVLEVALQPVVSARLAVSIVVIAINRSRASLARSGGNITGEVYRQPELAAKQVEPSSPN
jgi:hypothetical protein